MKNPMKNSVDKVQKAARKVRKKVQESRLDTGDASTPLDERTKEQLYNRARKLDIEGRSKMSKPELVAAIRRNQ